ncbi:MAG: phosphate--acyl-ACP acyltransferase [Deltaproteobacteria bacterium]|nr:phosphate--acyl-ACP acyltransferase [Deltaproteobacteria bacterium]
MRIGVDAMGGDSPLTKPIAGAVQAANDFGIDIVLYGDESQIRGVLKQHRFNPVKVDVVHCTEVVEMHESPALALRQKKQSSIRIALNDLQSGEVSAMISAGNTGAVMATAKFVLKVIEGIERPAIATLMPSILRNQSFVLLDIGANTDCKPLYLVQFAVMGDAYSRLLQHLDEPRIGLLNIGEESGKGDSVVRDTYPLLEQSTLKFVGNVEGKAMYKGAADVIVCDGFVGNMTLKVAEGTFDLVRNVIKQEVSRSWLSKLGYLGMRGAFQALKDRADYTEVGGAPLLGVNGTVIICHGNSTPRTLRNAIRHAHECAQLKLNDLIAREVSDNLEVMRSARELEEAAS